MENSPQFYFWKDNSCAYTVHTSSNPLPQTSTILLIHPIGVGLSGGFWQPFIEFEIGQGRSMSLCCQCQKDLIKRQW